MKNLIRQYRLAALLTVFVLFSGSAFVNGWLDGLKKPEITLIETDGGCGCGRPEILWDVRLSDEFEPVFDEKPFDVKNGVPASVTGLVVIPVCPITIMPILTRSCGCCYPYFIPQKRAYEFSDHRMAVDYPSGDPHNALAELFRYNGTQTLRKNTFAGLHRHTTRIPLIGGLR